MKQSWVDEAIKRPIAFSVVREDSLQDIEIIRRYFSEEEVSIIMVASGGCTAAALLSEVKLKNLVLVDANKGQLELSRLKIQLLNLPREKRLEILGYREMDPVRRKSILLGLMHALNIEEDALGPIDLLARSGLDFIGRYERVFEEIRSSLKANQHEVNALFHLDDVKEQSKRIASSTQLGMAIDRAFEKAMSQANLTQIFGEKATANRVQEFSSHFVERVRIYLSSYLASGSPWIAHLFLGHFCGDEVFPWLSQEMGCPFPNTTYFHGCMDEALEQCEPESKHVIHLSNILDWLSEEEAKKTLGLAYRALKPGGCVVIRQLNSNLDIQGLGKNYGWERLDVDDRSFFYRNFFLGFKPRILKAPKVTAMADCILDEQSILAGSYFKALPTMSKEKFQDTQAQFCHAVDYFSRPMAAIVARLPLHKDRIDIIHNIVEEHGDFDLEKTHSYTFRQFLLSIGTAPAPEISSSVNAFNYALMGTAVNNDPVAAIACIGIIEYAFADISALIGKVVVDREWVRKDELVHYNLHASIDKRHAEEFFAIIEDSEPEKVLLGLRMGAYIFNRLYEDLGPDGNCGRVRG